MPFCVPAPTQPSSTYSLLVLPESFASLLKEERIEEFWKNCVAQYWCTSFFLFSCLDLSDTKCVITIKMCCGPRKKKNLQKPVREHSICSTISLTHRVTAVVSVEEQWLEPQYSLAWGHNRVTLLGNPCQVSWTEFGRVGTDSMNQWPSMVEKCSWVWTLHANRWMEGALCMHWCAQAARMTPHRPAQTACIYFLAVLEIRSLQWWRRQGRCLIRLLGLWMPVSP